MKTQKIIGLLTIMLLSVSFSMAQPGSKNQIQQEPAQPRILNKIPNLTDKQKTDIKNIWIERQKKTTEYRNLLQEKRAHLKVLTTQDNPDQKEVDKTINEISGLKEKMMKENIHARMQIRALLTDEQKVYFDKMGMRHKKMMMNKRQKGMRNCGNK